MDLLVVYLLPFGLHTSSGLFEADADEILHFLNSVLAYQDDMILAGATKKEHDSRVKMTLDRLVNKYFSIGITRRKSSEAEVKLLAPRSKTLAVN